MRYSGGMKLCHIALGGNLGDVRATFAAALERLGGDDIHLIAASRLFSTRPMGSDAGGPFLNAAASIETSLDPLPLLDRLLAIEDQLGRRREMRWGPRAIDLDLIFYGEDVIRHPRLSVPHPECWYRRFVLDPLEEIAPDTIHAEAGETVRSLRSRLLSRPFIVVCDDDATRRALETESRGLFPEIEWTRDESQAVLTLSRSARQNDCRERKIALPHAEAQALEAARAVLVAALAEPAASNASD